MAAPPAHELRERVGRRVAEARTRLGLTQAQTAERIGVTPNYIARIEGGLENLTLDSIARLATYLKVEVAELFTRTSLPRSRPGRPRQRKKEHH